MINGFDFNGKHSFRDFGLVTKIKNRPLLPEPKIVVEEVPHRDGELDFSEVNPDKRTKYKPRTIEVECAFVQRNMKYLQQKAHMIAAWLAAGERSLIFDDETAVFYLARVVNRLDLENQIARIGRFTLQFKCRPFAFSRIKSNEQPRFGQGLLFGYGCRFSGPTIFPISGPTNLNIHNPGTYVKPLIRITGAFETLSFTCGNRTLHCNAVQLGGVLEVDCEKMEAVKDGSFNALNSLAGNFIEFAHGENLLQITGTGINCTITLIFNYLYF